MEVPARPRDEEQRLAALHALEILDSEPESAFDRITSLAATLFRVPTVLISFVDETRQWFKSTQGMKATETARDLSFCGHAILQAEPLVVSDAHDDDRFADNPLVTSDPYVRFYAGAPLTTPSGHRVGTLCLIDRRPRELSALERKVLSDMAAMVVSELELRAARRQKAREAAELQALLHDFPSAVIVIGEDNCLQFVNTEAEQLLGYSAEELLGTPYTQVVHPAEREESLKVARAAHTLEGGPHVIQRRMLRKSGESFTINGTVGPLTWGGKPALAVAMRDITLELRENDLRERQSLRVLTEMKLLLAAFDVLPDGIVLFDQKFRCVFANRALGEMLDMDPAELNGWTPEDAARHVNTLMAPDNCVASEPWRVATTPDLEPQVIALVRPRPRIVRRTLHALDSPSHPYMAVWSDITHEANALARSQVEASTDSLTGLPNRRAATTRLNYALSNGGSVAVVLFDIDHFKRVNDTYGHAVGDRVLQRVATTLQACCRDGDMVARWGGEEFIGILRGSVEGAHRFAERARKAVAEMTTEAGHITISAGVVPGISGCDSLKLADEKLYEAKRTGRNRVVA